METPHYDAAREGHGPVARAREVSLDTFFNEKSERSAVKARIVAKYFFAWANVVKPASKARDGRIAYIDLFAGPGRYLDGSKSTPLMILEQAIADPDLLSPA